MRKEKRKINAEDYTYDRGFKGQVNEAITAMLVKHLAYAKIFNSVTMGSFSSDQVTDEALNKLSKNGVDAVLAGELHHFYGFYDYHIYKQFGYSLLLATVFSIPVAIATT
ncbi:MAG: hypothetical protein D6814_07040 [Calditrichaeota bacterium]|nr:MAG: hypothetical protein D6814_07040 [Calditrichota bacterium]